MGDSVFISHASEDSEIARTVCRILEERHIRCWIAPRDIPGGDSWDEAIVRGLDSCGVVVLIFSSNANDSPHVKREIHRAVAKGKVVIPFRIENVVLGAALEYILFGVQWLDAIAPPMDQHLVTLQQRVNTVIVGQQSSQDQQRASEPQSRQDMPGGTAKPEARKESSAVTPIVLKPPARVVEVEGAKAQPATSKSVALLYKRNSQPDEYVLGMLEQHLREAGHSVFVDRHLRIGVEWAKEIERQVRESDAVVPLISGASLQSEMLGMEIQIAHESAAQQFGKPRILPVRVNFDGDMPEPFFSILGQLQYASWKSLVDDEGLAETLLDSLLAKTRPLKVAKDESPNGAVPLDSKYYIVQSTDLEFLQALERQDSIVLVKGARQMGKTSLLARGLQQARKAGKTVVVLDFQKLNQGNLGTIEDLYKAIGGMIADQLNLEVFPEDNWRDGRAPSVNFERYLRREVLDKNSGHFILAMDEVDRIFTCPYASEVFGLFRSWHNERASNPDGPWGRFTLTIVYATEAHLFITDQNQSPFNVGTRLELHDFGIEQVQKLNDLYELPLRSQDEIRQFYLLFNGHPYLTRRGFYEMTHVQRTLEDLIKTSDSEDGPFGDHLRRMLILLARDPGLLEVVKGLVRGMPCSDPMSFYRLRSGGLIVGSCAAEASFRCGLYERYLTRHLS